LSEIKRIGTCKPAKGTIRYGTIPIGKGHKIPVAVIKGRKKGKTCFISGGIHGDELNGMKLIHMCMAKIDPKSVSGTIIFLPLLNITGYHKQQRNVIEDNRDLNRCFGKRGASISYQIAKKLMKDVISKCDFGIDCHDFGEREVLLPHSRIHFDETDNDTQTLTMGRLFGTKVILVRDGHKGMMAIESFKRFAIPVLTIEIGGGLVIWDEYIESAFEGIKNILIYNGFLKGKIKLPREQYLIKDLDRFTYKSRREGLLYKKVRIGDVVHKGDVIAVIYDPITRKHKKIISKHCGFVFSLRMRDKINKGDAIASILQSQDCVIHGTKRQKHFDIIKNYPSIWDFTKNDSRKNTHIKAIRSNNTD